METEIEKVKESPNLDLIINQLANDYCRELLNCSDHKVFDNIETAIRNCKPLVNIVHSYDSQQQIIIDQQQRNRMLRDMNDTQKKVINELLKLLKEWHQEYPSTRTNIDGRTLELISKAEAA